MRAHCVAERLKGDVILLHLRKRVLRRRPIGGERLAHALHLRHRGADFLFQLRKAQARLAIRLDEGAHGGETLADGEAVHVERFGFPLVERHDHRRVAAKGRDQPQPVFRVGLLRVRPRVEHQDIDAALREEKLVRAVGQFLPGEIPHVQPHGFAALLERPGVNLDAGRFLLLRIEAKPQQTIADGTLARLAPSHEQHLHFIERRGSFPRLEVIGQDIGGAGRRLIAP